MRVLFCTDGSHISMQALKNFSKWQRNAIIDIICAIDYSFLPDQFIFEAVDFETSCSTLAGVLLEDVEKKIREMGMEFGEKIKYCGETVSGILEQTEKVHYDVILMGSHGKKGIQKWIGSVSRDIVNNADTTTYIAKKANNCEKVLFASDGSVNSKFAITEAIKYLDLTDKEIYICMVIENPQLMFLEGSLNSEWLLKIQAEQEARATKIIADLQIKFKEYGLEVKKFAILEGNPTAELAKFAKDENIDLIVTGTNGKHKKFLEGSISKRLLEVSDCDVITFK